MIELSPEKQAAIELLNDGEEYVALFFRKAYGLDIFGPLSERGWFAYENNPAPVPSKEPGFVQIPDWPVLDYLIRAAQEASEAKNETYAKEILEILHNVTFPPSGIAIDNYRTWWKFSQIISLLPTNIVSIENMDLISVWLSSRFDTSLVAGEIARNIFPKYLSSGDQHQYILAVRVVEIITEIDWIKEERISELEYKKPITKIEPFWLREIFKKNAEKLGKKTGYKITTRIMQQLEEILKLDNKDKYAYMWRPAIEDHEQNDTNKLDLENVLLTALREIFLNFITEEPDHARSVVESLFQGKYITFQRLGFFLINERFIVLRDLFWSYLSSEWFDSYRQHELYVLLSKQFINFSDQEKDQLLDLIESLEAIGGDNDKKEEATNYLRLKWLSAIKDKGYDKAEKAYQSYFDLVGCEPVNVDFPYSTHGGWVVDESPASLESLLGLSVDNIVDILQNFKPANGWKQPNKQGMADTLKQMVKQEPSKIIDEIEKFQGVGIRYIDCIISAYLELWNDGNLINWERLLTFCLGLINADDYWKRDGEIDSDLGRFGPEWTSSTIADLVRAGVTNDEHAFDPIYLGLAEKILTKLLYCEPSTARPDDKDAMTSSINTAKGRSIEAFFNYCLRCSRLQDKEKGNHDEFWKDTQPIFDKELELTSIGNFEFSTLCGAWLPNLYYLSETWVTENIDRIFSLQSQAHWSCAMQGFSYVNKNYKNIYELLKQHGHIKKALLNEFGDKQNKNRILELISTGYLNGQEGLTGKDSLFYEILRLWRDQDISHVIWFFWKVNEIDNIEMVNHVMEFWGWCSKKIENSEESNAKLLSDLSMLAVYISDIGEREIRLLKQCAPYVEAKYNSAHFLEYLDRLAGKYACEIANIFIKLLESSVPSYPADKIESIVKNVYEAGLLEEGNKICDRYLEAGNEFLRDIWTSYNNQPA